MLGAAEQRLFRQLGVFVGGFTLEAVEALIDGGPDDLDPLEAISTLVGQSVVGVQPPDEGTPRYRMLETIREFALERLEASRRGAADAPPPRRVLPRPGRARRADAAGDRPGSAPGWRSSSARTTTCAPPLPGA